MASRSAAAKREERRDERVESEESPENETSSSDSSEGEESSSEESSSDSEEISRSKKDPRKIIKNAVKKRSKLKIEKHRTKKRKKEKSSSSEEVSSELEESEESFSDDQEKKLKDKRIHSCNSPSNHASRNRDSRKPNRDVEYNSKYDDRSHRKKDSEIKGFVNDSKNPERDNRERQFIKQERPASEPEKRAKLRHEERQSSRHLSRDDFQGRWHDKRNDDGSRDRDLERRRDSGRARFDDDNGFNKRKRDKAEMRGDEERVRGDVRDTYRDEGTRDHYDNHRKRSGRGESSEDLNQREFREPKHRDREQKVERNRDRHKEKRDYEKEKKHSRRDEREWDRNKNEDHHVNNEKSGLLDEDSRKSSNDGKSGTDGKDQSKEEPNFELSGKLTEFTNTFKGVVIKYNEPPEARKPKTKWRLYPFKGDNELPVLHLHRQSAYLLGRNRMIADIPVDHPSCSSQHAVIQFRLVDHERPDGMMGKRVKPYVIDLESSNGTFVNNNKIDSRRYFELQERDVLKFGYSSREYVILHDKSKDDDSSDDDEAEAKEPK